MSRTPDNNLTDTQTLRQIIREEVTAALQAFTGDPDAGLTVRDEFLQRLETARQVPDEDLIPFSDVKEKHS